MVLNKNLANAVGGKTARACDNCIRKRARWYCTADDAFLCQSCDSSVHSANPLARRHQRVRLKTASSSSENFTPTWHKGFAKKARTPRNVKRTTVQNIKSEERNTLSSDPLVPELGRGEGENSNEENNEERLAYRVPTLDPFETSGDGVGSEYGEHGHGNNLRGLFVPSEVELAEFAADVENLLGFEEESFDMEALGLLEQSKERGLGEGCLDGERVKVEEREGDVMENRDFGMEMEPFEFNFDYDSSAMCEEEEANVKVEDGGRNTEGEGDDFGAMKKKKKLLSLDYEGVLMAWDGQKSPWTGGDRPELDLSECWPHCMGSCGSVHVHQGPCGGIIGVGIGGGYSALMADGGREARVSRYREKRRTRLFSKKIRYEVRKLNAEKRPRMKGRFVKRVTFAGPAAAFPCKLVEPP